MEGCCVPRGLHASRGTQQPEGPAVCQAEVVRISYSWLLTVNACLMAAAPLGELDIDFQSRLCKGGVYAGQHMAQIRVSR